MKNAESKLAGGAWRRFLHSAFCLLHLKMVPEVGIAPTSPRLQRGANLPQLLAEMVVPAGNAPASSGYQPGALLLSYRTACAGPPWRKASVTLRPRLAPILFSRQVQPAYICLPSVKWSGWRDSHSRPPRSELVAEC